MTSLVTVQFRNVADEVLMTPSQMVEELNKHIIGQTHAKKVLAVAIYNHYKRLKAELAQKHRQQEAAERDELLAQNPALAVGTHPCTAFTSQHQVFYFRDTGVSQ